MTHKSQRGVALIAAIFLVVVIGAAVTLLAVLSSRNSQQTTQSLLLVRAQLAANAGLEATIQSIVLNPTTGLCATAPAETTSTVSVPAYSDYLVTVTCQRVPYNRPSQEIFIYNLVGQAEFGSPNNADYVWAELTATIEL